MNRAKLLFLCLFGFFWSYSYGQTKPDTCDKVEASIQVKEGGNVKVTLLKGDSRSAKYIFCEEGGKVLNENQFETPEIKGLQSGNYFCIVNTVDCSKKIDFQVE